VKDQLLWPAKKACGIGEDKMALKLRNSRSWVMTASALAMIASTPALAQEAQESQQDESGFQTIIVTSEKREASIQDVPIAVSAFDQDLLDAAQIDGGQELLLAIPNVVFSKSNFAGYNFAIRGIGSASVATSGDAGVAIHQNGAPLTANRLLNSEFYDVERVEVLRGPQGTLYGRNATGGVINVITAKPSDEFSAAIELTGGDYGNLNGRGHINIPLSDSVQFRVAGTVTQKDGFTENLTTGNSVDGRDQWAVRASLNIDLADNTRFTAVYEHFNEDSTRVRTGKQLCVKDVPPTTVGGVPIPASVRPLFSQGCRNAVVYNSRDALYSGATLGGGLGFLFGVLDGDVFANVRIPASLREINSAFDPVYRASSDVLTAEFYHEWANGISFTSLTSHNLDSVFSNEDYNKVPNGTPFRVIVGGATVPITVTDPQLGSSTNFRTFDISRGDTEAFTQEFRFQSDFDGLFNFNVGGLYISSEIPNSDYYVFSNTLTFAAGSGALGVVPIDTSNPTGPDIGSRVNNSGRNYFLSRTPYKLESTAVFGEAYFTPTDTLKFTLGLRQNRDNKFQRNFSTALLAPVTTLPLAATAPNNAFFESAAPYDVDFEETTGRALVDWKPDLAFTDDTLVYASYSRGYKPGGFNPPNAIGVGGTPLAFDPELVDAIEIGTKNTFADGRFQLNLTGFNYDYSGYQISKIINRTSVNSNIDAKVMGVELESIWAPVSRLVLTANVGYLKSEIQKSANSLQLDVLNRTQGNPALTVLKNADNFSNCVVNTAGLAQLIGAGFSAAVPAVCRGPDGLRAALQPALIGALGTTVGTATMNGLNAAIFRPINAAQPLTNANTNFDGVNVETEGNRLPASPEWTVSLGGSYTFLLPGTWSLTPQVNYYWQAESYARIFNTARDVLPSWSNVNLSATLDNADSGIYATLWVKNATDEEVITNTYLTDDSSGLFTNVFLTDPRTYGLTIGKRW
jgi:outer membrane receptor protein involved in Fe transport